MKNKNILILGISLKKGGAERVISLILKKFIKDKSVSIYVVMMEDGVDYDIPSNIKLVTLSKTKKSGIIKLLELPFVAWQVARYIKENNIDLVMSFLYRPNYVNILAHIWGGSHKSIINIRSTTSRYLSEGLPGKVNLFLIRLLFNNSDLIVSNSKGVDEDLKSLMNITTDTKVIYNPVDVELIHSKKNICEDLNFNFKCNVKYIASIGRLIPLKRNKDLIDAFYRIQKTDTNLELIFLGDGILKNSLIEYCVSLGIDKKVHFLGNVKNPFYYLSESDLFVMNSEIEGFPNVLVEAMACGLPVISSDCKSGPREILEEEKYGLLYPVGDVNVLIEKMKYYLYEDIDMDTIRLRSLKRIKSFNINRIMSEFKELFEKVV